MVLVKEARKAAKRDFSIDRGAVKALVTIYGPREAARKAGVPFGTVAAWCWKYKWKKAVVTRPVVKTCAISGKDAGDVIRESLEASREASTLHLAKYTERASQEAAEHAEPLAVARAVKDVAGVYSTLWPVESESSMIQGAILVGEARVTDNPEEILRLTGTQLGEEDDVRQELPGS